MIKLSIVYQKCCMKLFLAILCLWIGCTTLFPNYQQIKFSWLSNVDLQSNTELDIVNGDEHNMENGSHPITLVTAYFPLKKAKHSSEQYKIWISKFLATVRTPMVIYLDEETESMITKLRNGTPTQLIKFKNVWDLPSMKNLKEEYENTQHNIDPEKLIHSPELYAIWNSKLWMLENTSEVNPFNSTYFFWVDIGSFRYDISTYHDFSQWPHIEKVNQVFRHGKLTNFQTFAIKPFEYYSTKHNFSFEDASKESVIIGGFYGGPKEAIRIWSQLFYEEHDRLMKQGYFIGKDQYILNYVAIKYKELVLVTCPCGRRWWRDCKFYSFYFYFQNWYAKKLKSHSGCTYLPAITMDQFLNTYS